MIAKNKVWILLFSLLITLILILMVPRHFIRYFTWNFADINDHLEFPFRTIQPGDDHHQFPRISDPPVPVTSPSCRMERNTTLDFFLEKTRTTTFLFIRNDSILYDYYAPGYDAGTIVPGFSIAKSVVSALAGIALEEKKLEDLHQPCGDYLEWIRDEHVRSITLEELLTMRAGLRFSEQYQSPLGGMARYYYGLDLRKYAKNLRSKKDEAMVYEYQSAAAQLIGMAIESASGMSIDRYLEEKIWKNAGMVNQATWNIDSEKHGQVKAFCCLNATPVDFALFGRLFLHDGRYSDRQVVPEPWVKACRSIINDSRDSRGYPYSYFWRATERNEIFAKGILGQYLYVNYDHNIIIFRSGAREGDLDWIRIFGELADRYRM